MDADIDATWERIEAWLAAHAPGVLASLNPPATLDDIAATEALIGRELPDCVRRSYLRHDGQQFDKGLVDGWDWLDLEGVRNEWTLWKSLTYGETFAGIESNTDGEVVSKLWWNPGWIPITGSGSGDNHCVDLAPGPNGVAGQIIQMFHDDANRPRPALSYGRWMSDFADQLAAGEYVTHPDYNGLVRRSDV